MFDTISRWFTVGSYDTHRVNEPSAHLRLARNTALSGVAIALLGGSRLLFNVVTGRRFGPVTLGQVTLAINTAMFVTLAVSGGWQASTARHVAQSLGARKPGEAAWIYRRSLLHNTAGGLVVAAGCWAWLFRAGDGLSTLDTALAAGIALSYNAYQHLKASMYGFGQAGGYLKIEVVSSATLVIGVIIVAMLREPAGLLVPVVVAYVVFAGWSLITLRAGAEHPVAPPAAEWRAIKEFTVLATLGTIFSAGFLNLSPAFVRHADSSEGLGLYSAALALVLPIYFLPRALSLALFPSISYRFGQERLDEVQAQLQQAGRGVAVMLLLPCALAASLAAPVMSLIFGAQYRQGGQLLAILMLATYLSVAQIPFVTALSGTERRWYRIPVVASALGFGIGLASWTLLGERHGAAGIAWGYLAGSIPQAVIPIAFAARVFKIRVGAIAVQAALVWVVAGLPWMFDVEDGVAAALTVIVFIALFGRELAGLLGGLRRRAA